MCTCKYSCACKGGHFFIKQKFFNISAVPFLNFRKYKIYFRINYIYLNI